jgi:cardiolipin synthase
LGEGKERRFDMRKKVLILIVLLFSSSLWSLPADEVIPIPNREYFPALHEALKNAKEKIYVLMFTARYYPDYPDDANSVILKDLLDAKKRGVDVKVILDASSWNVSNTLSNKMFGDSLKAGGVEVYYDPVEVTSHDKLILIDGYITIIGSTNWSYYALERNNEASVLIKSKPVTEYFEKYFEEILKFSTKEFPSRILQ